MALTTPPSTPPTFDLPDKQPQDTELQVLNQTFKVHSSVLKMHAEYFRRLFDSAEKDQSAFPQGPGIRYRWITHIEADGGWYLTWENSPVSFISNDLNKTPSEWMLIGSKRDAEGTELAGDVDDQVRAFTTVLCGLYHEQIEIYSVEHLELTTQLADFYGALPETSKAITSSLFASQAFTASIPENCVKILELSYKLRNKVLFKECGIHCTGPWRRPKYPLLEDPILRGLCETVYQRILQQIGLFFQELLGNLPSHAPFNQEIAVSLLQTTPRFAYHKRQGDMTGMDLPGYFCQLQKNLGGKTWLSNEVKESLKQLLHSELLLDRSACFPGEPGIFSGSFLCAEIKDSELPWDVNEKSW
jgi:hypothetical protein